MSDSLVDLLDRIVDTGVAAAGDVTISLADVELITLRLNLMLDSIGTEGAPELTFPKSRSAVRPQRTVKLAGDEESLQRGLAQLVLVVVELLAELLERQSVRRMAAGTLDESEVHALGNALAALHKRIEEVSQDLVA
ncbi:MAG TPA: gas vesicle protein GvpJ [Gaiellaceae bacterium]|jgi:hypothetical protein